MLRNSLMTLLGESRENNAVVVKVGELLIDVEAVAGERECIALILNPDDLRDALKKANATPAALPNT
jgi:predicted RNA-binding protein associated with RNAse of E/G family